LFQQNGKAQKVLSDTYAKLLKGFKRKVIVNAKNEKRIK
jgi:hypothetical protein